VLVLSKNITMFFVAILVLVGCNNQTYSPADIKPVYKIRNSPIPVPDVQWNPRRGSSYANKAPVPRKVTPPKTPPRRTVTKAAANRIVTVKKGDTLYAISRVQGVPVRSLISVNGLRAPYSLAVGQKLRLPGANTHTVRKGDTGYGISRKYGVTVSALMKVNNIRPPYSLKVGQKLHLPGGAKEPSTGIKVVNPTRTKGRTVAMPTPPARSASGFIWPVKGRLASRFGPREGGLHNDGINILTKAGAPVKAAESGVVVYASNALQGYGNLLLLKHADGWITAYAHNERLLVRKGQKVNKGQVVARVGSTGGVTKPQLHFEIRKGSRALDPLNHLSRVKS